MTKIKILAIIFAAILVALALGSCSGIKPQPITTDSQKITAKPTTEITTSTEQTTSETTTEQTTTVTETVTTGGGTTEPEITTDVTTKVTETETTTEVSYSTTHEEITETTSVTETTTEKPVETTTDETTIPEETTTVEDTTQAKKTYTLTVKYLNRATGGAIKTQAKYTYEDGQEYYITAPAIKGYTPEKGSLSGVITKNATIIFYYVQHEETTESESTEVTESTTEFVASTTEITETTEATTTEEPIETTEETTTPEETTTAEPIQLFTLTVYYVYKNGGTASETHVEHLPYNSSYNVSSPVISGYSVDKATVSGKLTKNTSVTVTYTKITMYSLTIYYSDYDTAATLSQSHYELLPSGSQYSVDSPVIEGYDLQVASNATISGTLTSDYEVTVWYVKKQGQGQGQGQETPTEKEEKYFLVKIDATIEERTGMSGVTTKYIKVKDKNNNTVTINLGIRNEGKLFNRDWVLDHGNQAGAQKSVINTVSVAAMPYDAQTKQIIKENSEVTGKPIYDYAYYDLFYAYSIKYGNNYITGTPETNNILFYDSSNTNFRTDLVYVGGETITVELIIYLTDENKNIIQTIYDNPNYKIYCASSRSDYLSH